MQGRIWRWEPTKIPAATQVGCRIDLLRLAKVGVPTRKEFGRRTGAVAAIAITRRCRAKPEVILRVRVENFADFAGKGVQFKRFFEVVVAMFGNAAANGGIVGVTRHE